MVRQGWFADNLVMRRIEVKQLDDDLTPVGGLSLVWHYLQALNSPWARLDGAVPVAARRSQEHPPFYGPLPAPTPCA